MLSELEIKIDEIKNSKFGFVEKAEQVDLFSDKAFTRITLFESYRLYIQTLYWNGGGNKPVQTG